MLKLRSSFAEFAPLKPEQGAVGATAEWQARLNYQPKEYPS